VGAWLAQFSGTKQSLYRSGPLLAPIKSAGFSSLIDPQNKMQTNKSRACLSSQKEAQYRNPRVRPKQALINIRSQHLNNISLNNSPPICAGLPGKLHDTKQQNQN
jgi:hypothetical protein